MNAIISPLVWTSSQSLPFDFDMNAATWLAGWTVADATGLAWTALGLRISRVLRRCDLAMSACSVVIQAPRQSDRQCLALCGGVNPGSLHTQIRAVGIMMWFERLADIG
jgi:hypothetical protein